MTRKKARIPCPLAQQVRPWYEKCLRREPPVNDVHSLAPLDGTSVCYDYRPLEDSFGEGGVCASDPHRWCESICGRLHGSQSAYRRGDRCRHGEAVLAFADTMHCSCWTEVCIWRVVRACTCPHKRECYMTEAYHQSCKTHTHTHACSLSQPLNT